MSVKERVKIIREVEYRKRCVRNLVS